MGPNSSLDELALVTASRHVRRYNDSALTGTGDWSQLAQNDTTTLVGAIPPNNTVEEGSQPVEENKPEFQINVGTITSLISNLESMRSLDSYQPETSVESMETSPTLRSPTLQEREPGQIRNLLETSLLVSQAVTSPTHASGEASAIIQPITINLFAEAVPTSKVTTRRRSRSLGSSSDVEMRTYTISREPAEPQHLPLPTSPNLDEDEPNPRTKKRGRDTANLSDLSLLSTQDNTPVLAPESAQVDQQQDGARGGASLPVSSRYPRSPANDFFLANRQPVRTRDNNRLRPLARNPSKTVKGQPKHPRT